MSRPVGSALSDWTGMSEFIVRVIGVPVSPGAWTLGRSSEPAAAAYRA
jgi:hypothetical protein